jgi:hypothetical protein
MRKFFTAARVSPLKRSTPTAVRSSSVRVRLGNCRKKLTPTSRQSTCALTFWFTAVFTRAAIWSLKSSGRTSSSRSRRANKPPAPVRMVRRFMR